MNVLDFLKKYRIDVIIVLALYLLAFGIRTVPSGNLKTIYGFDSYWGGRQVKYLITGEQSFPYNDMNTDYPYGRKGIAATEIGWWAPNALVYNIAAMITGTQGFNYDLFGKTFSWMVVILGSLIAPVFYLLGKEMFNRKTGLLAGLFISVLSNHAFYSIFGHAENDAFGLVMMFLCLLLFVVSIKKKNYYYLAASAIAFFWANMTWVSYRAVLLLICGTIVAYYLLEFIFRRLKYIEKEDAETKEWMLYNLALYVPASCIGSLIIMGNFFNQAVLSFAAFTFLAVTIIEFIDKKPKIKIFNSLESFWKSDLFIKTGCVAVILLTFGFAIYGSAMFTGLVGFGSATSAQSASGKPDYEQRMLQTIAEQNTITDFISRNNGIATKDVTIGMKLDYLAKDNGFGIFVWFSAIAALIAVGKMVIKPFMKKELNPFDITIAGMLFYSVFFLTERLQTFFFLSSIFAFGSAYFFNEAINGTEYLRNALKQKTEYAKAGIMCVAIIVFMSNFFACIATTDSFRNDITPGWEDTLKFLNSVPKDSVIAAWWDYGHWMNYYNGDNVKVNLDNIQDRPDIIYTVAKALTHTTSTNCVIGVQNRDCPTDEAALEKAEIESLSYLKPLKSTHILVDDMIIGGVTGGKADALQKIAGNEPGTGKFLGCMQLIPSCFKKEDGGVECPLGSETKLSYTKQEWEILKKYNWPGKTVTFNEMTTREFAKELMDGTVRVYLSALQCYNFYPDANSPILFSFMERMFFRDPSLKHVKLVYDNDEIVVYEINWKDIPDPEELGLENVLPKV